MVLRARGWGCAPTSTLQPPRCEGYHAEHSIVTTFEAWYKAISAATARFQYALQRLRKAFQPYLHFELEDEPKTFLPHQRTIHDLRTSASLSCFVCYRLLQDVLRRHLQLENVTLAPSSYLTVVWTRGRLGPNHKLPFEISSDWKDHLQRDTPRLKLEQFEICPHPARSKQVDREAITSSTDITLNAAIGQQWIDDCIRMHPKCRQSLSKGWHPTRLLDVSDRYRIVLVESKPHNIVSPYMILSHCWGTAEILKLTRDTYNIFRKGFSVADLPRTFANAVTVAQTFNVQYIWIDSLCIIQDSASDWAREAISMFDVYQNSMCNIGASAASSSDGGLFRARDVELIRFPRIINDKGAHMVTWTRFWGESVNSAPLYKRRWVVQERWLCPRMLHFDAEQIFWEY